MSSVVDPQTHRQPRFNMLFIDKTDICLFFQPLDLFFSFVHLWPILHVDAKVNLIFLPSTFSILLSHFLNWNSIHPPFSMADHFCLFWIVTAFVFFCLFKSTTLHPSTSLLFLFGLQLMLAVWKMLDCFNSVIFKQHILIFFYSITIKHRTHNPHEKISTF